MTKNTASVLAWIFFILNIESLVTLKSFHFQLFENKDVPLLPPFPFYKAFYNASTFQDICVSQNLLLIWLLILRFNFYLTYFSHSIILSSVTLKETFFYLTINFLFYLGDLLDIAVGPILLHFQVLILPFNFSFGIFSFNHSVICNSEIYAFLAF